MNHSPVSSPGQTTAPPLISVVISTRSRPDLLMRRAIPSALTQRYPNLEVLVATDSPDPRLRWLMRWKPNALRSGPRQVSDVG